MVVLALDLSTTSTGYAVFKGTKLVTHGLIKPKVKGISKMKYPQGVYNKIVNISQQVKDLVAEVEPDMIVIEEINRGVNRISQKSLDALHFFVMDYVKMVDEDLFNKLTYIDSDGAKGWRNILGLKLSAEDKEDNKLAREHNKINKMDQVPIITKKDLAQRFVNSKYKLDLDVQINKTDSDICDAIALGDAFINKKA